MTELKHKNVIAASKFPLQNEGTQTASDGLYRAQIGDYFDHSTGTVLDRLNTFARFVPRQALAVFLARHELFRLILEVQGSIVECGVFQGEGLFSWAQFSAIHEPVNHGRKIVAFDTFAGFPEPSKADLSSSGTAEHKKAGGYCFEGLDELVRGVELYDLNRPVGHIPKVELVKGDAVETIPRYLESNPHLVVALLHLDFDLYEPTRVALRHLLPRMPKGAVLVFDELNQRQWPGETQAVVEEVGLRNLRIKRFSFTPAISFAVIE